MSDAKRPTESSSELSGKAERVVGGNGVKSNPPAEPVGQLLTRRWVVVSFWLVALLLGVPIWWITTTVYRANLPLQRMSDWAEGKICSPIYPLTVALEAPALQRTEAQYLLRSTQHTLDDLNHFPAHHLRLSLPHGIAEAEDSLREHNGRDTGDAPGAEGRIALSVKLTQEKGLASPRASLRPHTTTLDVFYSAGMLPSSASSPSILASFIATELQQLFVEEQAILATMKTPSSANAVVESLPSGIRGSLAKRTTRSLKYAPTYHLSFSLLTPTASPSDWDIEQALSTTFLPLLKALAPISNFTMDTQVQLYSTLPPSIKPTYDETRQAWILTEKDLGGFINAAEWPLAPNIGAAPTINFLIYAAPSTHSPLLVQNSGTNSWLVPQWGGVTIFNAGAGAESSQPETLSAKDLRPALLTFSNQLMSLLGVPATPSHSLQMRLSTLIRVRAASTFYSASSTLGSLGRLVSTLPSISIPDSVAENVATTMARLEAQCADFRNGDFEQALQNGKVAEQRAERAFFEKSMVGQVYFPDEHKVAVYLPLLGPVAVPLVVSAIRELKAYLSGRRKQKIS